MTDNNTNDSGQISTPQGAESASDKTPKKPKKIEARKNRQGAKRSSSSKGDSNAKGTAKRKPNAKNRRNFIIGFIALIVLFDVVIMSIVFFSGIGPKVAPSADPVKLIQEQLPIENTIPEIGYDTSLTFANHTDLTIANTASMKPIENNLLKKGAGPNGSDLLYDALIVNRILRLNTDWIDYLNQGNEKVFESLSTDPKAPAKEKLIALGNGSMIAYHRIALGEIRHIGSRYYILAQASYILVRDGQQEAFDDVFVYELIRQGDTMVVSDFERIPQMPQQAAQAAPQPDPAATAPADGTAETNPEVATEGESQEQTEGDSEEQSEGTSEDQPEGTAEE
jgi:hypothetical protein